MRAKNRTLTLRPRPLRRVAVCALMAAFACLLLLPPAARADDATPINPEVRVTTNMGSFVIELRPDRAPHTVANFLRYVRAGFYNNTLFHRVVANFVIQGGGHDATAPYPLKETFPPIDNESGNGLQNKRGAVGLARTADPDTGNAQFYINLVDNPELDPLPTRWGYAVFGQIVEGMDVVDRIGVVPTGAFGPFKADAPLKPVIIQSIEEITPPGLSTPPASAPPAAPPAGAPPTGTSPSGTSPSTSPQPGASPSPQPPASNPQAPPNAKPAKPPAGGTGSQSSGSTPPPSQSQSGESDQPDGT